MTTILIRRSGAAVLFRDDFSSGNFSHTQNGGAWVTVATPGKCEITTDNPRPGQTYSIKMYQGDFNDIEIRLAGLTPEPTEIYYQWYVYYPSGSEVPSVGPMVVIVGTNNDKCIRGWGDANAQLGTAPAVNTVGASFSGNGTGGYTLLPDASVTTVTAITNIAVSGGDTTKITSSPTLTQYGSIVIPASAGFPGGTYLVNSVAAGVATLNASCASSGVASGGTGTQYFNALSVGPSGLGPAAAILPSLLGTWIEFRYHAKEATIANNDGVIEIWVNRVLAQSHTNIANYKTQNGPSGLNCFYLMGACNTPKQPGRLVYLADVTVSTGGFIG